MEHPSQAQVGVLSAAQPYVRREMVFLALGAMDVCAIAPLYAAFLLPLIDIGLWSLLAGLLLVILPVLYFARLLFSLPVTYVARSALIAAGIVVSGAVAVHGVLYPETALLSGWVVGVYRSLRRSLFAPDILIFLLVAFLWWRGLALAQRRLDSASVAFRFRLGVVLLAVTTGIAGSISPWPYHELVYLFFFVSLLGIALARAEEVGQQYGGRHTPFGLGWLTTMMIVSAFVLALAAGLTSVLTGRTLGRVLLPVLRLLQVLVFLLIYALAWLAQFLIQPLVGLLRRYQLGERLADILDEISLPTFSTDAAEPAEPPFTPGQLEVIRLVVVTLGGLIVLLLVALSLARLRRRSRGPTDGVRESVWEGFHLRAAVAGLMDDGLQRLRTIGNTLAPSRVRQLFAALTVRRIYAHMASLAARLGYPRPINETPYDYLPTLRRAFPEAQAETVLITESYVLVHYGELPEETEELARVRSAWERIQKHYPSPSRRISQDPEAR